MSSSDPAPGGDPGRRPNASRMLTWWFGLMGLAGLLLGSLAEQPSSGADMPASLLILFVGALGIALAMLYVIMRRRPREHMSARQLMIGCAVGLAAFAIGNWFGTHLGALR